MIALLFIAVLLLTYSNGANDNFKGVATLWGSGTLNYKATLALATIATFAGCICSYFFASALLTNFSGKGLVPDGATGNVDFILSVALGAGLTVLVATMAGFPISTTHSLVGALVGAGFMLAGSQLHLTKLFHVFFVPLLASPFIAVVASYTLYKLLHYSRSRCGITEETCVCIGNKWVPVQTISNSASFAALPVAHASVASEEECTIQYQGKFLGFNFHGLINRLHYCSAAIVSFARGLNDTPKLVSLLLVAKLFQVPVYISVIALAMAIGGILNAKKVAVTMSTKISRFNNGQGFTANVITGFLVIVASKFGLPVSTTHVSVGSIYGIGIVNKTTNKKAVSSILMSWLLTLPIAALLSGLIFFIIKTITK